MIAMNPSVDQNMKKKSRTTPGAEDPRKKSRGTPYELRRGNVSLKDLVELQDRCSFAIQRIGNAISDAKDSNFNELYMDGCTQLQRAMTLLESFDGHIHAAINKAKFAAELESRQRGVE